MDQEGKEKNMNYGSAFNEKSGWGRRKEEERRKKEEGKKKDKKKKVWNSDSKWIAEAIHKNDFQIMAIDDDWFGRGVRESVFIRALNPSINDHPGRHYLPHVYDDLVKAQVKEPPSPAVHDLATENILSTAPRKPGRPKKNNSNNSQTIPKQVSSEVPRLQPQPSHSMLTRRRALAQDATGDTPGWYLYQSVSLLLTFAPLLASFLSSSSSSSSFSLSYPFSVILIFCFAIARRRVKISLENLRKYKFSYVVRNSQNLFIKYGRY